MQTSDKNGSLGHPRYWLTWLGMVALWLLAKLPLRAQFAAGKYLGWMSYHLSPARRHITTTNVCLCFPELSAKERQALVKKIFDSTGIGLVETAIAWFGHTDESRVTIEGLNHLQQARSQNRGVILIGAHFSTLDITGAQLARKIDFDIIYRRNKNTVMEYCMRRGREQHIAGVIERSETRVIVKRLREGHIVWYAADQDYGLKHSVFAPFFGQQAATIFATGGFARMNNSRTFYEPFSRPR